METSEAQVAQEDEKVAVPSKPKIKMVIGPKKERITEDWTIQKIVDNYVPYGWEAVFESAKDELADISKLLEENKAENPGRVLPNNDKIFAIFHRTPPHKVRVVLAGMDPYHTVLPDGNPQAVGMSFSVPRNAPIPSSLRNIYKELATDLKGEFMMPSTGDLFSWTTEGVFLINAALTTRQGEAGAHGKVWLGFIKKVLKAIVDANEDVIFLLWGKNAEALQKFVGGRVTCLIAAHPSGLSANRGFFGCKHFSQVNEILAARAKAKKVPFVPIDWNVY